MSEKYDCPTCGESFDSAKGRGTHRRWNHDNPWDDPDKLREKYVTERLSMPKIAEMWSCGETTIEQALEKHGIETRDRGENYGDEAWKDKDTLKEMYEERGMSMPEIADELGCHHDKVRYNIENFEIERRDFGSVSKNTPWRDKQRLKKRLKKDGVDEIADDWGCHPGTILKWKSDHGIDVEHSWYSSNSSAYSRIEDSFNNEKCGLFVHQLVAYAHKDIEFEDLFNSKIHIHHKNGVKWLNNPENLEVLSASEHLEKHSDGVSRHIR
jgi:transposase-like protein